MTDKEFWEKCGLVEQQTGSWYEGKVGGEFVCGEMPPSTGIKALGFLFKYAVPKLGFVSLNYFNHSDDNSGMTGYRATARALIGDQHFNGDKDPAQALRKVIEEVWG